jgi:hypothetical protein
MFWGAIELFLKIVLPLDLRGHKDLPNDRASCREAEILLSWGIMVDIQGSRQLHDSSLMAGWQQLNLHFPFLVSRRLTRFTEASPSGK